jgi:hypothetical protein
MLYYHQGRLLSDNPVLSRNLVSVSDLANNDYTSTFSRTSAILQGPAGMFDLIKTSNVYLLPVNPKDDQVFKAWGLSLDSWKKSACIID